MTPRLMIITCFWQRAAVSRVYWAGIRRLRARAPFKVLAVVTPGDDPENLALAHAHADAVLEATNAPLSAKWNAGAERARMAEPDYVMKLDSDDLLSDECFDWLLGAMRDGAAFAGPAEFHFYDAGTRTLKRWPGYPVGDPRAGFPAGSGRIFSAATMADLSWQLAPGRARNRSLDGALDHELRVRGITPVTTTAFAVDVKTHTNIWKFSAIVGDVVPADRLATHLSPDELTLLAEVTS